MISIIQTQLDKTLCSIIYHFCSVKLTPKGGEGVCTARFFIHAHTFKIFLVCVYMQVYHAHRLHAWIQYVNPLHKCSVGKASREKCS